jgi:hypothetical protein
MANFLDDLSVYNAKAAVVISQAAADGNTDRANMMSSLKSTANDITLSEAVRLNALTALINMGSLLDIPLPPFFPQTVTYANTETYIGIHNDLAGIQGGAPGDYQHITTAQLNSFLGKASLSDISFANLQGVYSDNASLQAAIDGKQNALSGVGFVKINGNQLTISYDNSTYLTSTALAATALTGELSGTIGNPTVNNAAVIAKVLTGWNGSASYSAITSSDSILSGMEKLNARISQVIASPGGVSSIIASTNAPSVLNVAASSPTGAVTFSVDFDSQNQNRFLASPNGTNGVPSFRSMVAADLPNSGATPNTYGSASLIPIITVDAKGRITFVANVAANAGGLVNSVSLTGPSIFTNFTSTGTTSVLLGFALQQQIANRVFAGPASGANAVPTFRALVEDDIPTLSIGKISGLANSLANKLDNALNDGEIWIGNSTNAPQMRSLSQDIKITRTGVATIQPNVVDFSKIQEITGADTSVSPEIPGNLLGRWAAGQGDVQEVVLSGDFLLDSITGVLSLSSPVAPVLTTKGGLITFSQSVGNQVQLSAVYEGNLLITDSSVDVGLKWVTAGGDIEIDPVLDGTFNILPGAVTLAKMADLPAFRVIGNDTSGTLAPKALTKAELTTLVNQFTSTLPGVVPASGGGSTNFLRADGSWAVPPGAGGSPAGSGSEVQYRLNSTTFGAIPYMSYDSTGGEIRTAGPNFLLVDDVTTVTKSVSFDISLITNPGESWAFPDTSDTFVGELYAQTLENKTLSTGTAIDIAAPVVGTMWYSSDTAGTLAEIDPTGLGGKYLMLNATTLIPEWTGISGGGIAIGDTITGATAGSVLFAGTAGVLAQENGDFFWDNTNKFLGIGTALPECGLHVVTSGSSNIKGIMNMHFDSNAANQAKFIGARARGSKGSPSAIQADDAITSLSGRGYKTDTWSNTVGGFYIYASQNWTNSVTGTYLAFRGVANGGTAITEWGRISNDATTTTFNIGATSALALTTAATTASIFNTTATTLNIGGAATAVNLGGGSGCAISLGGGANAAELRFVEPGGPSYAALKAPSLAANYTLTLPVDDGNSGQILRTDGSGVLSWVNNTGGTLASQYISNTVANTYSSTTLGVAFSLLIPANTFGSGDVFQIRARLNKSGGGSSTLRVGFNTTNANLTGITYVTAQVSVTSSPNLGERTFSIDGTTTSYQSSTLGFWGAGGSETQIAAISSSTAIDWTVDQYFIIAGQMASGDVFTQVFITIIPQN